MYSRYSVAIVRLCSALIFVAVLHEWVSVAASPQVISDQSGATLHSPMTTIGQPAPLFQATRRGLPRRREGGGTRYTA